MLFNVASLMDALYEFQVRLCYSGWRGCLVGPTNCQRRGHPKTLEVSTFCFILYLSSM